LNNNDDQVQIIEWHVNREAFVKKGDALVDIETSKTAMTVESEYTGHVVYSSDSGDLINVGQELCKIFSNLDELTDIGEDCIASEIENYETALDTNHFSEGDDGWVASRYSKRAKNLCEELGVDLASIDVSGLITSAMILKTLKTENGESKKEFNAEVTEVIEQVKGPIAAAEKKLQLSKKEEISQLVVGQAGLINSTLSITFNSTFLRDKIKKKKIFQSIQPILLFEISQLIRQYPKFTAYFEGNQIKMFERVDLGLAVDLGKGLKVVTIRDCDSLDIEEISEQTLDVFLRYSRNELEARDLTGSTFTVTDLSGFDILNFTPLINGHQSVIIGIGADSTLPDFPMSIIVTFDHRVLTGSEVANFLKKLRANITSNWLTS
jgi:pyruvate/2-oxoglutarate dehydrogenase complex dihydrolipoamide acyltransferase (E2) component